MTAYFLGPGAGEERQNRALGVETPPLAEHVSIRLRGLGLQERMSDKGRIRPGPLQRLHLERQNQRQTVRIGGQLLRAAGPPGPDLRDDVVEHGDLTPAGSLRDSEIEASVIDRNHEIHDAAIHQSNEPLSKAVQKGESRDNLGDSHDGQPVEVGEKFDSLLPHAPAADAEELTPWPASPQGHDEARGVLITGGLAGEHQDGRLGASARVFQIRVVQTGVIQNRKPRYQITARSMRRRITSVRGVQPDFLSIQFFFRSRRMRISDMALPFDKTPDTYPDRSGGDAALAGANERQQMADLRDLLHLVFSDIQGSG